MIFVYSRTIAFVKSTLNFLFFIGFSLLMRLKFVDFIKTRIPEKTRKELTLHNQTESLKALREKFEKKLNIHHEKTFFWMKVGLKVCKNISSLP